MGVSTRKKILPGIAESSAFDSSGHLPVGIRDCSLRNLSRLVCFNEHRRKMWAQLTSFLIGPALTHQFSNAYVGGGFLSTKPKPNDIDVILETTHAYGPEAFAAVSHFFVLGLSQIENVYGVRLKFWMQGAPAGLSDYRSFFQYHRPGTLTQPHHPSHGIVRINLAAADLLSSLRDGIRGEVKAGRKTHAVKPADLLDQFSLIGRDSTKIIVLTDARGRTQWVNERFTDTCGYTLEEARGKTPGKLLQGPRTDPTTVKLLRDAIRHEQACDCLILNYKKNGTPYYIHLQVRPVINNGRVDGYFAIADVLGLPDNLLTPHAN